MSCRPRLVYHAVMSTPPVSIGYFLLAAMLGAVGQFLYKTGADRAAASIWGYLFNIRLAAGVACYVAVMVLFVAAFKKGGSLSVLYPIYASTFIWGALIAWWAFGQPVKPVNVLGMLFLVGGMYFMGK